MGILASDARMLLDARKNGVDFTDTMTIGDLTFYVTQRELKRLQSSYDIPFDNSSSILHFGSSSKPFFSHFLGVKNLKSIDFSDYQGAFVLHDMNYPVPEYLEEAFDAVIDGGSLEHIFNFPAAITNCMKMVKVGGSLFIFSIANNYCGHGFYQFSPELFFRLFQPEFGFSLKDLALVKVAFPGAELSRRQIWYHVTDPARLGRRSTLVTRKPLLIAVHAIRTAREPILDHYPQQSDYVRIWKDASDLPSREVDSSFSLGVKVKNAARIVHKHLPLAVRNLVLGYRELWSCSLRDREFYKKW